MLCDFYALCEMLSDFKVNIFVPVTKDKDIFNLMVQIRRCKLILSLK